MVVPPVVIDTLALLATAEEIQRSFEELGDQYTTQLSDTNGSASIGLEKADFSGVERKKFLKLSNKSRPIDKEGFAGRRWENWSKTEQSNFTAHAISAMSKAYNVIMEGQVPTYNTSSKVSKVCMGNKAIVLQSEAGTHRVLLVNAMTLFTRNKFFGINVPRSYTDIKNRKHHAAYVINTTKVPKLSYTIAELSAKYMKDETVAKYSAEVDKFTNGTMDILASSWFAAEEAMWQENSILRNPELESVMEGLYGTNLFPVDMAKAVKLLPEVIALLWEGNTEKVADVFSEVMTSDIPFNSFPTLDKAGKAYSAEELEIVETWLMNMLQAGRYRVPDSDRSDRARAMLKDYRHNAHQPRQR